MTKFEEYKKNFYDNKNDSEQSMIELVDKMKNDGLSKDEIQELMKMGIDFLLKLIE